MAYVALDCCGIDNKSILSVLCSQKPEPGRMSRFDIEGKRFYLLLSKNPNRGKNVMLAVNDRPQDGEDVSWIWDVDFETLLSGGVNKYIISGERRFDMYLRLKYADYDEKKLSVYDGVEQAVLAMLEDDVALNYLLVNYSAMYPAYKMLRALEEGGSK